METNDMDYNDTLAARFDFDSWRSVNRLERRLFVQGFFISDGVLADWRQVRSHALPEEYDSVANQSMWESEGDRLLSVLTYEAPSLEAAHSAMLEMLEDIQSPLVVRHEERVLGDVSFGDETGLWVLFSAANVVAFVRNAGREVSPVEDEALNLVSWIEDEPQPGGKVVPEIERVAVDPTDVDERWLLSVTAADPLDRDLMIKIFSEGGQVMREDDQLIFHGGSRDIQSVRVVAINKDRGVASMRGVDS